MPLRASPGEDRPFERLYEKHAGDVYRYVLAVLRNAADAEDVTQTTFMNAYRAYARGERAKRPDHWLIAIAHNVCRQRFRQSLRRPQEVALDEDVRAPAVPDERYTAEDLRRALGQLAFNQRSALVMRELEGRSYAEIADLLGISLSAVETLLFRARRALREQLEGMLTCGEADRALSKQLEGLLTRSEKAQLRAHLRACPDCATLGRSQRAQRSAWKALGSIPLPASLGSLFGGGGATVATSVAMKAAVVAFAGFAVVGGTYEVVKIRPFASDHKPARLVPARTMPAPLTPAPVVARRPETERGDAGRLERPQSPAVSRRRALTPVTTQGSAPAVRGGAPPGASLPAEPADEQPPAGSASSAAEAPATPQAPPATSSPAPAERTPESAAAAPPAAGPAGNPSAPASASPAQPAADEPSADEEPEVSGTGGQVAESDTDEKQEEKEEKAAERQAEKAEKAAEKQAEKEQKAAEKEAEKAEKEAERQAEKAEKEKAGPAPAPVAPASPTPAALPVPAPPPLPAPAPVAPAAAPSATAPPVTEGEPKEKDRGKDEKEKGKGK